MANDAGTVEETGRDAGGPAISAHDFKNLVEMVGADMPEVLIDLLDTYVEESAGLVKSIVTAFWEGDENGMLRPSHSLKSSSASIGALQLSRLCAALENYTRGGSPGLDVAAVVAAIDREFGRVKIELAVKRAEISAQR